MNNLLSLAKNGIKQNFQDIKNEATNIVKTTAQNTMDDVKKAADNTITNVTNPMLHSTNTESSSGANPSSAPAAPQAPSNTSTNTSSLPVSQSVNNNNNLPSSSSSSNIPSTESQSKDIVGDLKHSIFSDQELNILELMKINHLESNVGEDVVNEEILGLLKTALNNQLSTEKAKTLMQDIIVKEIPKVAEKIANFDNNTLAELIFKKTMDSIDFRKHLTESLQKVSTPGRIITSLELVDILIRSIMTPVSQPVNNSSTQIGGGIGNIYPFKSRGNSKTRVRPKRHVKII